jgi:hypothetical protein
MIGYPGCHDGIVIVEGTFRDPEDRVNDLKEVSHIFICAGDRSGKTGWRDWYGRGVAVDGGSRRETSQAFSGHDAARLGTESPTRRGRRTGLAGRPCLNAGSRPWGIHLYIGPSASQAW